MKYENCWQITVLKNNASMTTNRKLQVGVSGGWTNLRPDDELPLTLEV